MALKFPRKFVGASASGGIDALQYEIAQERAAVLARLGRKLEDALAKLEAHDAAPAVSAPDPAERDALVGAAGEALWYFVVQREVLGLRDSDAVMRELRVPREVRLRMGLNRRPADHR
jgi:hypothetical protein